MRIDKKKLCLALEREGRMSSAKLALMFNVSETAVRRAIKRLEDKKIIKGYHAEIDKEEFELLK